MNPCTVSVNKYGGNCNANSQVFVPDNVKKITPGVNEARYLVQHKSC